MNNFNFVLWLGRIGLIFLIISLGTVIDYFAHQTSPFFSVPFIYFPHKIFYGTLWAFIGYLVFKRYIKQSFWLAFTISIVPATALQIMYFIQMHLTLWVVILFLVGHFFMFLIPGFLICKILNPVNPE